MLACFPEDLKPSRNFSATWCGAHISTRAAALYWVSHAKDHLQVFLRCDDAPEVTQAIQRVLPSGVALKQRPRPRKGIAITTPLFFFVYTDEQALNMGPLLRLLLSGDFEPNKPRPASAVRYWAPNSEKNDHIFVARAEGNKVTIAVNKYERNRKNREQCIEHYGPICSVCRFDFSVTYGDIGKGYIHVHHLDPLGAQKGRPIKVHPIEDLRPVCPNCHEMLHRTDPPYTIEKLKSLLTNVGAHAQRATHPL
jgi:hypothetical protein